MNEHDNYDYPNDDSSEESSVCQIPSRDGISKGRPLEKLIIHDGAFDQLNVGMQFENWNHANLVLLAYGKQTGLYGKFKINI